MGAPEDERDGQGTSGETPATPSQGPNAGEVASRVVGTLASGAEAVRSLAGGGTQGVADRVQGALGSAAGAATGALGNLPGVAAAGQVVGTVQSLLPRSTPSIPGGAGSSPGQAHGSGAGNAIGAAAGGEHLREAGFRIAIQGEEADAFSVLRFHASEALSTVYELVVELVTTDLHGRLGRLAGRNVTLHLERDGEPGSHPRRLLGLVRRVEELAGPPERRLVRLAVVPGLWTLSLTRDTRAFEQKTAREIVATVLREQLADSDRAFRDDCQRPVPRREMCVQYDETALAFVQRLCESEGIHFYFDHSGEHELLVLTDSSEPYRPVGGGSQRPSFELVAAHGGTTTHEAIQRFDVAHALTTTVVTTGGYNFTDPTQVVRETSRSSEPNALVREQYRAASVVREIEYDPGSRRYGGNDAAPQALLLRQEQAQEARTAEGASDILAFCAGQTFTLAGDPQSGHDGPYLLTAVRHEGEALEALTGGETSGGRGAPSRPRYQNTFTCVPVGTPVRPPRTTSIPRLHGSLTALVVGPTNTRDDHYVDPHDRIRVQFHWDRRGERNEHSSAWVRLAQSLAGAHFGAVVVPRIGMEVIVTFLHGDPDQPLVTGCVYNGDRPSPYPLPAHVSRSVFRTQTTPGRDPAHYNELSFDDAAGSEEVLLRAEKDWNTRVLNDRTTAVGHDQSNTVGHDAALTVGNDYVAIVRHDASLTVTRNLTETVHGERAETTDLDHVEVTHGNHRLVIDHAENVHIGTNQTTTILGCQAFGVGTVAPSSVPAGCLYQVVAANLSAEVRGNRFDHTLHAHRLHGDEEVQLKQGESYLTMRGGNVDFRTEGFVQAHNPAGDVRMLRDGSKIEVRAEHALHVQCGESEFLIEPTRIRIASPTVEIVGARGGVACNAQGTQVSGADVGVAARGNCVITGGVAVKIN